MSEWKFEKEEEPIPPYDKAAYTVDVWTSGIHVQGPNDKHHWGNRIEVYGNTEAEALQLRDLVFNALANQKGTS